jgi:hypothetical protein
MQTNNIVLEKPKGILQKIEQTALDTGDRYAMFQTQVNTALDFEAQRTQDYFKSQSRQIWGRAAMLIAIQSCTAVAGGYWAEKQVMVKSTSDAAQSLVSGIFDWAKTSSEMSNQDIQRKTGELNQLNQYLPSLKTTHQSALDRINQQRELASRG